MSPRTWALGASCIRGSTASCGTASHSATPAVPSRPARRPGARPSTRSSSVICSRKLCSASKPGNCAADPGPARIPPSPIPRSGVAMTRARKLAIFTTLITGLALVVPLALPAQAVAQTKTIGVDYAAPAGHLFEYVDFFPRDAVTVHRGDTLDFAWALNASGFHNVVLLATDTTPGNAWATKYPLAVPDTDDAAGQLKFNDAINFGVGLGGPIPCGSTSDTACIYTGDADIGSAASGTDGRTHFFVTLDGSVPAGALNFVCLVHPGMAGSVTVIPDGNATTTPAQDQTEAAAQGVA